MVAGEPLIVDTALTAARFLGEVVVIREGDTLTVAGLRAPSALYHVREAFGGGLLLGGATALVLAAGLSSMLLAQVAAATVTASAAVYGLGYLVLYWRAHHESASFEQASVQGLEVRTGPRPWQILLFGWISTAVRTRRLTFNVVDERFKPTEYEFRLDDDEELVELAALLAREYGAREAGTVRVR